MEGVPHARGSGLLPQQRYKPDDVAATGRDGELQIIAAMATASVRPLPSSAVYRAVRVTSGSGWGQDEEDSDKKAAPEAAAAATVAALKPKTPEPLEAQVSTRRCAHLPKPRVREGFRHHEKSLVSCDGNGGVG